MSKKHPKKIGPSSKKFHCKNSKKAQKSPKNKIAKKHPKKFGPFSKKFTVKIPKKPKKGKTPKKVGVFLSTKNEEKDYFG